MLAIRSWGQSCRINYARLLMVITPSDRTKTCGPQKHTLPHNTAHHPHPLDHPHKRATLQSIPLFYSMEQRNYISRPLGVVIPLRVSSRDASPPATYHSPGGCGLWYDRFYRRRCQDISGECCIRWIK